MSTYTLKQWYPTLPKDWKVGMVIGQGDRGSYGNYSPVDGSFTNHYIAAEIIEKSPDFWTKVEEVKVGVTIKSHTLIVTTKDGVATYSTTYKEQFQNELQKEINRVVGEVKAKWIKQAETDLKTYRQFGCFCITDQIAIK